MKTVIVFLTVISVAYSYVPQLDGRIVGGKEVDISDFPYQASVRLRDSHLCGGSIIDKTTILTAAHCVHGMDHSQYSVRVGSTQHREGHQILVSRVIENPYYNPGTYDNDVAILKLSTPLAFSSTIQCVELQPEGTEIPVDTTAWVSGWGVTKESSQVVPATLRAVDVAVIGNGECSRRYGTGKITQHMMCAQTLGHDSCQGDSGGPLVANGKLVGVVSWGHGCAKPQYPGVYAKVSNMFSWIIANK